MKKGAMGPVLEVGEAFKSQVVKYVSSTSGYRSSANKTIKGGKEDVKG